MSFSSSFLALAQSNDLASIGPVKSQVPIPVSDPPQPRVASWVSHLSSCTGSCIQKAPCFISLCCHHLKILSEWNTSFSFCPRPCKLCLQSCPTLMPQLPQSNIKLKSIRKKKMGRQLCQPLMVAERPPTPKPWQNLAVDHCFLMSIKPKECQGRRTRNLPQAPPLPSFPILGVLGAWLMPRVWLPVPVKHTGCSLSPNSEGDLGGLEWMQKPSSHHPTSQSYTGPQSRPQAASQSTFLHFQWSETNSPLSGMDCPKLTQWASLPCCSQY